ncbi:Uncharacterized protein TCM_026906 [Theobroma cacao]|uniref:Uncharacterized protein n=1 Tax=Theobroma cacao TaxID=3641 RepID=A0A061G7D8_THECC|nr:Uncharacterized protein TCM_026906 [Theobroma cacao]
MIILQGTSQFLQGSFRVDDLSERDLASFTYNSISSSISQQSSNDYAIEDRALVCPHLIKIASLAADHRFRHDVYRHLLDKILPGIIAEADFLACYL